MPEELHIHPTVAGVFRKLKEATENRRREELSDNAFLLELIGYKVDLLDESAI